MDAMAKRFSQKFSVADFARLWQLPLLLFSIALFGYALFLLIDPTPDPSVAQRVDIARGYLRQERPDAAIQLLNRIFKTESLDPKREGEIHLMLAESIELGATIHKLDLPSNHKSIIDQTQLAIRADTNIGAEGYRRMAAAYEALGERDQALEAYEVAQSLDVDRVLRLHRTIIQLLLDNTKPAEANDELLAYLNQKDLSDTERSWALGMRQLLIDQNNFSEALVMLDNAAKLTVGAEPQLQGELSYRQGYAAWKLGQLDQAERHMRMARDMLGISNPLDADAAYALGRIYQTLGKREEAASFFESVIVSHPVSRMMPLARIERGVCRAMLGDDDAALQDFETVTNEITRKPALEPIRATALDALQRAEEIFWKRENALATLEILSYEKTLNPAPTPPFLGRMALAYEKRATQIQAEIPSANESDQIKKRMEASTLLTKAGGSYITFAEKLLIDDDEGYAELLWKGIDAYDRAGNTDSAIAALTEWVNQRPDDPETPKALLRLGKTYQAAGLFDKAIAAYTRNQMRYPTSLESSRSAVPLAQSLIAKGPDHFTSARETLINVIDNNPMLDPSSLEFREAVFELAHLYYKMGEHEQAVARLEEFATRYPDDARVTQVRFMMADSYRQSAKQIGDRLIAMDEKGDEVGALPADRLELVMARRERLRKSRTGFDTVVESWRSAGSLSDLESLYLKLAHFYRADSLFDLGEYAEAIKIYDTAAFRYQNDPSALAAYVQIVNSYVALGRPDEARTANERARVLLRRIPPEAFGENTYNIPREFWDQWLTFAGESRLW